MSGSKLRNLGRAVLMGTAVGLSAGACTLPAGSERPPTLQTSRLEQDYAEALATRSPALVTRFIRTYSSSSRSATLLNQMPASVLAQIPRSAVANLDDRVKRRLSARVRGQFGITLTGSPGGSGSGGGFGY